MKTISCEVVVAYSQCPRKAFLLLNAEDRGIPHEYVCILNEQAHLNRTQYLDTVKQSNPAFLSCRAADLTSGEDVFIEVPLKFQDLEASCDLLTSVPCGAAHGKHVYEPTIVFGVHHISKEHKMALSFTGYVVGQVQNRLPEKGHIVTAGGKSLSVGLKSGYKIMGKVIEQLRQWTTTPLPEPPPVILNKHCPYCQFRASCRAKAEQEDHLSLLDGISTSKAVQKYEKHGVFTVRQLSYLYKPRRRKKRVKNQPHTHKPELQALAIRTGKVHVQVLPELIRKPVELFLLDTGEKSVIPSPTHATPR
jgi:predicted RecB family nuclease